MPIDCPPAIHNPAPGKHFCVYKGERGGWWGEFERGEAYDDRMLIFADFLTRGEHKYSYVVQATTPGRYYQPSALAEGMYEPEVFGRTAATEVEIQK